MFELVSSEMDKAVFASFYWIGHDDCYVHTNEYTEVEIFGRLVK
jgi:hypothetical protein